MLSIFMLSVAFHFIGMLNVIMLSVVILSVVMLNVVMLNVVVPPQALTLSIRLGCKSLQGINTSLFVREKRF
jgi:hypothetical protein